MDLQLVTFRLKQFKKIIGFPKKKLEAIKLGGRSMSNWVDREKH